MEVVRKLRRLQPAGFVEVIGLPHMFPAVPPVGSVAVLEGKSQTQRWFLPRGGEIEGARLTKDFCVSDSGRQVASAD
jgi:hypothetical protein